MSNVNLRLLVLKTPQVDRVVRFYEALGFAFVAERHGSGPEHYSAGLGDGIIEIYPLPDKQEVDTSTRLGFSVADPDTVVNRAEQLGGGVVRRGRDTEWGYLAIVTDPDGRTLELYRG